MSAVLILTFISFLVVFTRFFSISFSNSYFLVVVPVVTLFFVHGKILFIVSAVIGFYCFNS